MFAGAAFLIAVLSLEPGVSILVAVLLTAVLVVLKVFRRTALRAVEGEQASQARSGITFGFAGVASLAIGWGFLDDWLPSRRVYGVGRQYRGDCKSDVLAVECGQRVAFIRHGGDLFGCCVLLPALLDRCNRCVCGDYRRAEATEPR